MPPARSESVSDTETAGVHPATRAISAMLVLLVGLTLAVMLGWQPPNVLGHRWHLLLHVLGAIMFLGNVMVGALLVGMTAAQKSRPLDRFVSRFVQWADVAFTAPGAILLVFNGAVIAAPFGGIAGAPWLSWSVGLFAVAGVIWGAVLVPLQHRFIVTSADADRTRWERVVQIYNGPGALAGLLLLAVLVLMVVRP